MRDAGVGEPLQGLVQRDRIGRRQRAIDVDRAARRCRSCRARRPRRPSLRHIWRAKAATEVLPLVPVTATIVVGLRGIEARGSASESAARASSTRRTARRGDFGRALGDDRRRALGERVGGMLEAVVLHAREREEGFARRDLAAVGREARDLERGETRVRAARSRISARRITPCPPCPRRRHSRAGRSAGTAARERAVAARDPPAARRAGSARPATRPAL